MTIENFEPTAVHTISGIGPYAVTHPFASGALALVIVDGDQRVPLVIDIDYTVTPDAGVTGDVFLAAGIATGFDGAKLYIDRSTPASQGWKGVQGAREVGLERQLDLVTMAVQDLRQSYLKTLRTDAVLTPFVPQEGATIIFVGGVPQAGPTAAAIIDAEANAVSAGLDADRAEAAAATAGAAYASYAIAAAAHVPAPLATIRVLSGGVLLDYVRTAVAEHVALTTADGQGWKPASWAMFQHFGAAADGATNDAAAVQKALRSGIPIRNRRFDTFLITGTVSAPDVKTYLRGGIIKTTMTATDAIQLHSTIMVSHDWDEFCLLSTVESTARGLSITFTSAVVALNRHLRFVSIGNDVEIGGVDAETGCYGKALHLDNVHDPRFGTFLIRGRRNLASAAGTEDREYKAGTIGVNYTSSDDGSPVTCDMSMIKVRAVETCIMLTGRMEGFAMEGGQLINCRVGINADYLDLVAGVDQIDPGFFVRGVHINAAARCVIFKNMFEAFISDNECYRFTNPSGIDWICFEGNTVSEAMIHGNQINGAATTGTPGAIVKAALLTNFKRSHVFKNHETKTLQRYELVGAGSVGNVFEGNTARNGTAKIGAQQVVFSGGALEAENDVIWTGQRRKAVNGSLVTVLSGLTNVVSISIPDAIVGEEYEFGAIIRSTKGGTSGITTFNVNKSGGTGTATFDVSSSLQSRTFGNNATSADWHQSFSGFAQITGSGTIQLAISGTSATSDSTVAAGDAAIWYRRVK
jgi:hypothetical protein